MKHLIPALAAALWLSACSSTRVHAPAPAPARQPDAPQAPVKIVSRDLQPEPLPDTRCDRVVSLATAGDYKPAADQMDKIENDQAFCHDEALELAAASRRLVADADAWIHSSTERKRVGDVAGARQDLLNAIEVYPKYYWAKKLLRDLGGSSPASPTTAETVELQPAAAPPAAEVVADAETKTDVEADVEVIRQLIAEQNLELARIAEQEGDLEAASRWAITAVRAEPADGDLRKGIVEYARLLGLKFFSAGELSPAREIWGAAFALDGSDERLRDYLRQVDERLANLEQIRRKGGQ